MKKIKLLTPILGLTALAGSVVPLASCGSTPKEDPVSFKVTFNYNYDDCPNPSIVEVKKDELVTKPQDPTRPNYKFTGWYKDKSATEAYDFSTKVTSAFTLYAGWIEDKSEYTITFDSMGGSAVPSQTVISGDKLKKPADPTKQDYTFVGWYKTNECKPEDLYSFDTPVTSTFTLYAGWQASEEIIVIVSYNDEGTTSPIVHRHFKSGDKIDRPADPTREHYKFDNWYNYATEKVYDFNNPITESTLIYANWIPTECTVTFETNGGSTIDPVEVKYNDKVDRPSPDPTKDGYALAGWYKDSEFKNIYNFNSLVTSPMTLYAKWVSTSVVRETVSFDTQGGTPETIPSIKIYNGERIPRELMPKNPTKSGAEFIGWAKNSSGTEFWDFDKDVVRITTPLYAIWKPIGITKAQWTNAFNNIYNLNTRNFNATINGGELGGTLKVSVDKKHATSSTPTISGWLYEDYSYEFPLYLWYDYDWALSGDVITDTESLFYIPYKYLNNRYNSFVYESTNDWYVLTQQIYISSTTQINEAEIRFNLDKLISYINYDIKYEGVDYKYTIEFSNYGKAVVEKPENTPDIYQAKYVSANRYETSTFATKADTKVSFYVYLEGLVNNKPIIKMYDANNNPINFKVTNIFSDERKLTIDEDYVWEGGNQIRFLKDVTRSTKFTYNFIPESDTQNVKLVITW